MEGVQGILLQHWRIAHVYGGASRQADQWRPRRRGERTGAETLSIACPFCATMLADGLLENGSDMRVRDIIDEATE